MVSIVVKRVYEPVDPTDGFRILVDRLWPRGLRKDAAAIDLWAKEVTPSTPLRQDFHSGHILWPEFEDRYLAELSANPALDDLSALIRDKPAVTLLVAGRDTDHTHAKVLVQALTDRL